MICHIFGRLDGSLVNPSIAVPLGNRELEIFLTLAFVNQQCESILTFYMLHIYIFGISMLNFWP